MKLTSGLYAYCIIARNCCDTGEPELPDGTFLVQHRDIAAVVERVSESKWQPTKDNIIRHQKIITTVQETLPILPLRFGMVFKDSEELARVLQDKYAEIQGLFAKVEGRVELSLRLFWHHNAFLEDIGNRKIEELKKQYQNANANHYIAAIEIGKQVESLVNQKREEYIREILEPLRGIADDSVLGPITGEKMVFNAAFLVKESLVDQFDEVVKNLHDQYQEKFLFRYSGPWPAYNFAAAKW